MLKGSPSFLTIRLAAVVYLSLAAGFTHARELAPEQVPRSVWRALSGSRNAVGSAELRLVEHPSENAESIDLQQPAATMAEKLARLRAAGHVELHAYPKQGRSFYFIIFGGNRNSEVYAVTRAGRAARLVPFVENDGGDESMGAVSWTLTDQPKRGFEVRAWQKLGPHGVDQRYRFRHGKFLLTYSREEHLDGTPVKP